MLRKLGLALAGLVAVGVAFASEPAQAGHRFHGWHGGGWHGGWHGGWRHHHWGFRHHHVGFRHHWGWRPYHHVGFRHHWGWRHHYWRPRPAFAFAAFPAYGFGGACVVKRRHIWTPWGPELRVRRVCW